MSSKQLKFWFDVDLAIMLAKKIVKVYSPFNAEKFTRQIKIGVPTLKLNERKENICDLLNGHIAVTYSEQLNIMANILDSENEHTVGMFKIYYRIKPIAKFVEKYVLDHFNLSMRAMLDITKCNTGEPAIKPYIRRYPKNDEKHA